MFSILIARTIEGSSVRRDDRNGHGNKRQKCKRSEKQLSHCVPCPRPCLAATIVNALDARYQHKSP
jgi:hypothetical protein